MFNKFSKDDLVAYSEHPKSIPLGVVKSIEEKKGKAVVMVYLFDTNDPELFGTISIKIILLVIENKSDRG